MIAVQINDLDLDNGYRSLFAIAIVINQGNFGTLHLYETSKKRENALKYWRREHKLSDSYIFLLFEIPLGLYLDKALKLV